MISTRSSFAPFFILIVYFRTNIAVTGLIVSSPTSHRNIANTSVICSRNQYYGIVRGTSRSLSRLRIINKEMDSCRTRRQQHHISTKLNSATQQSEENTTNPEEEEPDPGTESKNEQDNNGILLDLLCPSKDCKVNRMSGTDLGKFVCVSMLAAMVSTSPSSFGLLESKTYSFVFGLNFRMETA